MATLIELNEVSKKSLGVVKKVATDLFVSISEYISKTFELFTEFIELHISSINLLSGPILKFGTHSIICSKLEFKII